MIGAVASASVVIIPGIQAASAIDVPTSNVMIILNEKIYESISSAYKALRIILEENNEHKKHFYLSKITPYDFIIPAVQNKARKVPKATNHPYPPSGGMNTSLISSSSTSIA